MNEDRHNPLNQGDADNRRKTWMTVAVVVLAIITLAGIAYSVYAWQQNQKLSVDVTAKNNQIADLQKQASVPARTTSSTQPADPYAGWKECDDTVSGISFKYPSSWSLNSNQPEKPCLNYQLKDNGNGAEFVLQSPASNNLSFILQFFPDSPKSSLNNGATSGADKQEVVSVEPLTLNNKVHVSLVEYLDTAGGWSKPSITTMGLSDQNYAIGQTFYALNGITNPKDSNRYFGFNVMLAKPNSQSDEPHTVAEYKSQPGYGDLMNILKSLSY